MTGHSLSSRCDRSQFVIVHIAHIMVDFLKPIGVGACMRACINEYMRFLACVRACVHACVRACFCANCLRQ